MPAPELKYFDSERTASASVGYNLDVVKDALVVPAVGIQVSPVMVLRLL